MREVTLKAIAAGLGPGGTEAEPPILVRLPALGAATTWEAGEGEQRILKGRSPQVTFHVSRAQAAFLASCAHCPPVLTAPGALA